MYLNDSEMSKQYYKHKQEDFASDPTYIFYHISTQWYDTNSILTEKYSLYLISCLYIIQERLRTIKMWMMNDYYPIYTTQHKMESKQSSINKWAGLILARGYETTIFYKGIRNNIFLLQYFPTVKVTFDYT